MCELCLLVIGHYCNAFCLKEILIIISSNDLAKLSVQTGSNQFAVEHVYVYPSTIDQFSNLSLAVSVR